MPNSKTAGQAASNCDFTLSDTVPLNKLEDVVKMCDDENIMLYINKDEFGDDRINVLEKCVEFSGGTMGGADYGVRGEKTKYRVEPALLEELNKKLKDDTESPNPIRYRSNYPTKKTFAYFDVSDFSTYKMGQQALILRSLDKMATDLLKGGKEKYECRLCIGDGYIFVFEKTIDCVVYSLNLANKIQSVSEDTKKNELSVEFHFRAGLHVGPVLRFKDEFLTGGWNYVGDGINGGQRVLSAAGKQIDDVVYVSGAVIAGIKSIVDSESTEPTVAGGEPNKYLKDILSSSINKGRHADKHGSYWRIYQLNHFLDGGAH